MVLYYKIILICNLKLKPNGYVKSTSNYWRTYESANYFPDGYGDRDWSEFFGILRILSNLF